MYFIISFPIFIFILKMSTSQRNYRSSPPSFVGCHDSVEASCCPWTLPKPKILPALRALQFRLRAHFSVTSRQRHNATRGRDSLMSFIGRLGWQRSTRVKPFKAPKDAELCSAKSDPFLTTPNHAARGIELFSTVKSTDFGYKKRQLDERALPNRPCTNRISHSFTLPGAVIEDIPKSAGAGAEPILKVVRG